MSWIHFLFALAFISAGLSVVRTYRSKKTHYSKNVLTKFGMLNVFYLCFCLVSLKINGVLYVVVLFFGIFLPETFEFLFIKHYHKQFRRDLLLFLNTVLLNMRLGMGFRGAIDKSLPQNKPYFSDQIKKIMDFVVFSPQKHASFPMKLMNEVFLEFKTVDQQPHLSIKRVSNFKNKLEILESFRRKSQKITLQIRIQIVILCFFYLGLLVFSYSYFGFQGNEWVFSLSLFSFLMGLFCILTIYRRWKWKI